MSPLARQLIFAALSLLLAFSHVPAYGAEAVERYLASLPTVRAVVGDKGFVLWVARGPDQHSRGLKGVTAEMLAPTSAGEWRGMLFVFDEDGLPSFWMEDTLTDLDIAFIDRDWKIESTRTLIAATLSPQAPQTPIRYAIEVQAGLLERLGIVPGERVTIRFPGLPKD